MKLITKSEKFIYSRKDDWTELESYIRVIEKSGVSALTSGDIRKIPKLYRKVLTDLSEARMLKLSSDVIDYLNNLVASTYRILYSIPLLTRNKIKNYFLNYLPFTLKRNLSVILFSFIILILPYIITFNIVKEKPYLVYSFINYEYINELADSYRNLNSHVDFDSSRFFLVSFYLNNNVSIDFLVFTLGVFLVLPTIYLLIYNGVFVGAITGYLVSIGLNDSVLNFIISHSFFETIGLVFSASAGILLGITLIKAYPYKKSYIIKTKIKNIFSLLIASSFFTGIAAVIESVISPIYMDIVFKIIIVGVCVLLFLIYFLFIPLFLKRTQNQNKEF